jgi:tetrahydromethanopterin S-methyltransferase subunit G
MQKIQLYLKVVVEAEDDEKPQRIGTEICRQIQKVYGVRVAEVQSSQSETVRDTGL